MYLSRLQKVFVTLASIANFICAYLLFFVWKQQYSYFAVIIVASFSIGVVLGDFKEAIPNTFIAWIIGSIISIGILMAPAIIHGAEREVLDVLITFYGMSLGQTSLIVFPLILGVTTAGCYLSHVR